MRYLKTLISRASRPRRETALRPVALGGDGDPEDPFEREVVDRPDANFERTVPALRDDRPPGEPTQAPTQLRHKRPPPVNREDDDKPERSPLQPSPDDRGDRFERSASRRRGTGESTASEALQSRRRSPEDSSDESRREVAGEPSPVPKRLEPSATDGVNVREVIVERGGDEPPARPMGGDEPRLEPPEPQEAPEEETREPSTPEIEAVSDGDEGATERVRLEPREPVRVEPRRRRDDSPDVSEPKVVIGQLSIEVVAESEPEPKPPARPRPEPPGLSFGSRLGFGLEQE